MRREYIYDGINVDYDRVAVRNLTDRVFDARDNFFAFVSTYDGSCDPVTRRKWTDDKTQWFSFDSLWSYFSLWQDTLEDDMDRLWLDPRAHQAIWQQFLRLVPTIYLVICDAYDQDPSKLDLIERDPVSGKETRTERRVTSKLPSVGDGYFDLPEGAYPLTAEEREAAPVVQLLVGDGGRWPLVVYGPDVADGERKSL